MKGHAEIILTDVKSKKQEVIHEDNIVTNALQYFMQANLCLTNMARSLFPLYKNGIGGIFLFGDKIEENPDIVTVPGDVSLVGHASNDAYMGENNLRGSFNDSESEILSNGMKLVWDFTTNQANGEIKCLSLTSSQGGKMGFGVQSGVTSTGLITDIYKQHPNYSKDYTFHLPDLLDGNYYYEFIESGNTCTINKYYFPITKFKLSSELYKKELMITKELDTTIDYDYYAKTIDKGKIYLFVFTSKIATLYIIDAIDLNVISEADYTFVLNYTYGGYYQYINIAILDEYIYFNCIKSKDEQGVLKVKLDNIPDRKLIHVNNMYKCGSVFRMNNRIGTPGALIDKKDNVTYFSYYSNTLYTTPKHLDDLYKGLVIYHRYRSGSDNYGYLYNNMNYIVTINNLATPVVKTADKTMKIIYTLTDA